MARISRSEIDLAQAKSIAAAGLKIAASLHALVSIAVVDAGGHLIYFERMDGAEIAGPVLAVDKAYTAVAHRIATQALAPLVAPDGPFVGMNSAKGGRYICFAGGIPFWSGGRVIGGVGVSGGSSEEDLACATAAAKVFEDSEAIN